MSEMSKLEQEVNEMRLHALEMGINSASELLAYEMEGPDIDPYANEVNIIEAAYILNEAIKSACCNMEKWLEWWLSMESDQSPLSMGEYNQRLIKCMKARMKYQKYIEGR